MKAPSRYLRRLIRPLAWDLEGYYFFRCHLPSSPHANQPSAAELPEDFSIEEVSISEPHSLRGILDLLLNYAGRYYGPVSESWILRRFSMNDRCFCAITEGEIVGIQWASPVNGWLSESFGAAVSGEPNSWISNGAFVAPGARGHGVHRLIGRFAKARLREDGAEYCFTFVGLHNFASIRNTHRVNDEYRIIYHCALDVPLLRQINFFPKRDKEVWRRCDKSYI